MMIEAVKNWFLRDQWIPWTFVAMFMVIFSVNGFMVSTALDSWNGLVTENPYERGVKYNERIAAARAQEALGWSVTPNFQQGDGLTGTFTISMADDQGQPLANGTVYAVVERMTKAMQLFEMRLSEPAPGVYTTDLDLPLAGLWHVRVVAQVQGETYRLANQIYLDP